jgi:hypothetical protein
MMSLSITKSYSRRLLPRRETSDRR